MNDLILRTTTTEYCEDKTKIYIELLTYHLSDNSFDFETLKGLENQPSTYKTTKESNFIPNGSFKNLEMMGTYEGKWVISIKDKKISVVPNTNHLYLAYGKTIKREKDKDDVIAYMVYKHQIISQLDYLNYIEDK